MPAGCSFPLLQCVHQTTICAEQAEVGRQQDVHCSMLVDNRHCITLCQICHLFSNRCDFGFKHRHRPWYKLKRQTHSAKSHAEEQGHSAPRVDHVGVPLLLCFFGCGRFPDDFEEEDPASAGVVFPKGLAGAHRHKGLRLSCARQTHLHLNLPKLA